MTYAAATDIVAGASLTAHCPMSMLPNLPEVERAKLQFIPTEIVRNVVLVMPKHLLTLPSYANIYRRLVEFCRDEYRQEMKFDAIRLVTSAGRASAGARRQRHAGELDIGLGQVGRSRRRASAPPASRPARSRPLTISAMRSACATSSTRCVAHSIDVPCRSRTFCICATSSRRVAGSRPTEGSSISSRSGALSSARAISTRRWLPPDSVPHRLVDEVRDLGSCRVASAMRSLQRLPRSPNRLPGRRGWP